MQRFTRGGIAIMVSLAILAGGVSMLVGQPRPDSQQDRDAGKKSKTVLERFQAAKKVSAKLKLLPQLVKTHPQGKLPDEAKYLLAMNLLRPQLTWHAVHGPAESVIQDQFGGGEVQAKELIEEIHKSDWRWDAAHPGEPWMQADVPKEVRKQLADAEKHFKATVRKHAGGQQLEEVRREKKPMFFWRLKNPKSPDVAKAAKLLRSIKNGDLHWKADRWLREIERNNTVVTFDVLGGYAANKAAPVVMDLRGAGEVSFKLYRVERPADLLWGTTRIGEDFIYRDYGLQHGKIARNQQAEVARALREHYAHGSIRREQLQEEGVQLQLDLDAPDHQLKEDVSKLETMVPWFEDDWDDDDWDDDWQDQEADYFGDRCERFQRRLEKDYQPEWDEFSSWRCNRVVKIPAQAVKEPGGYLLLAEVNGQSAWAPIIVDPLTMVLRRCRDGVFAMVSDEEGQKPIPGAEIIVENILDPVKTDQHGVAFAKAFAGGERAIIAHKKGRFVVGGFGKVFEGVYHSPFDDLFAERDVAKQALREVAREVEQGLAHAYADRYVLAAYTDRPVYRPGQTVQFKLIARRLPPADPDAQAKAGFRAADFEKADRLEIPETNSPTNFQVIGPQGSVVGSGRVSLNDFGTAASEFKMWTEAKLGVYSMRFDVGGLKRIVPNVFAVKHYRRANFKLEVEGIPKSLTAGDPIKPRLRGTYYFGKPLPGGKAVAQLSRLRDGSLISTAETELNDQGVAEVELRVPRTLEYGRYQIACSLRDDSGRTVSQVFERRVGPEPSSQESGIPRFIAVNDSLDVPFAGKELVAECFRGGKTIQKKFPAAKGVATVKFTEPGWVRLMIPGDEFDLFAHGGNQRPDREPPWQEQAADAGSRRERARWVDLSDYSWEEDQTRANFRPSVPLTALLERSRVGVGEKLRVLIYAPSKRARVVFTMEGRTVVDYHAANSSSDGAFHVVEIPITPRHLPNFYLQGQIVSLDGGAQIREAARALREVAKQALEQLEEDH
ncbi:MAG: MG2 domain-containing protein, partial [Planctomycetales bacterium]